MPISVRDRLFFNPCFAEAKSESFPSQNSSISSSKAVDENAVVIVAFANLLVMAPNIRRASFCGVAETWKCEGRFEKVNSNDQ